MLKIKYPIRGSKVYDVLTQWAQVIKESKLIQSWLSQRNLLVINETIKWILGNQEHKPSDPGWCPWEKINK